MGCSPEVSAEDCEGDAEEDSDKPGKFAEPVVLAKQEDRSCKSDEGAAAPQAHNECDE